MAATKVSLKLLIDSKSQRAHFAEAGKEFVDFLITILALPVGTVIRLLKKQGMVGCLQNFYESIESLSDTYLQPQQNKDSLLKPKVYISGGGVVPLQLPNIESSTSRKFCRCVQGHAYVSDDRTTICPSCTRLSMTMTSELTYVDLRSGNNLGSSNEEGYVKGVVTYMVMDDLVVSVVKPMSTISSITLLNNFNVKEVGALVKNDKPSCMSQAANGAAVADVGCITQTTILASGDLINTAIQKLLEAIPHHEFLIQEC